MSTCSRVHFKANTFTSVFSFTTVHRPPSGIYLDKNVTHQIT